MKFLKEHIIDLIAAYHQKTISPEGLAELNDWLDTNPDHSMEFANYLALLKETEAINHIDNINHDEAWEKISKSLSKTSVKTKTRRLHLWMPYAAAVAIIFIVSTLILQLNRDINYSEDYNFDQIAQVGSKKAVLTLANGEKVLLEEGKVKTIAERDGTEIDKDSENNLSYKKNDLKSPKAIYNFIEVPRGGEYKLNLSDGTKVWLNSESSLKYPVQFAGNIRKVELTGEAYFDVSHDKTAPFIVKARDTEIKVLGTEFNISTYDDDEFIATTLVEGSVEVNCLGSKAKLSPGFQSVIKRGDNHIEIIEVDTQLYTSWVNGVFEFENHTLEQITQQLSRWYDVDFFFTEKQFRNLRFTGAIKRDKSIDFALEMMEKIAQVKFAIKDDKIIIGQPAQ